MNKKIQGIIKRLLDIICSFIGLIILAPLFLIVAILIKLDSKGPIFFRQERIGKNGKIFKIYKFRTMYQGSEKLNLPVEQIRQWEKEDRDPRITKIGRFLRRFAIDESPQLINILKGEMSIVGPRAFYIPRINTIDKKILQKRCQVKPGLAGLAVIKKGVKLSEEETMKYDLEYVERQNLWLDLQIFLKTCLIYLKKIFK